MRNRSPQPRGKLALRTVAMQADTNSAGDVYSGWIMYMMDLAVGIAAGARAKGRVATATVSNLVFSQTLRAGDVVCVYTSIAKVGKTSIAFRVEVYALRNDLSDLTRVTEAEIVAVAVDDHKMPRMLPEAA